MRAISTVLDVAIFLLLVSAAVGTLVLIRPPADTDSDADETAEILASSTASVEYELRGETRRAHGTFGTLLARATVANATLEGAPLSTMEDDFAATVVATTRSRLVAPNRTQVIARWRPYEGAPLSGRLVVGSSPPDGVDVHAATVTVPAPVDASHEEATAHAESGYAAVGHSVATAVTAGLLPANRVDASVARESPAAIATTHRY